MTMPLPHTGVLVRLGISAIHGIGVFACTDIPRGTIIFASDRLPLRWTAAEDLQSLELLPFERAFYDDFAVHRDGMLGTPQSFDLLSVGWYVNQPADGTQPNLVAGRDLSFVTARQIEADEELTIDYATFSPEGRAI